MGCIPSKAEAAGTAEGAAKLKEDHQDATLSRGKQKASEAMKLSSLRAEDSSEAAEEATKEQLKETAGDPVLARGSMGCGASSDQGGFAAQERNNDRHNTFTRTCLVSALVHRMPYSPPLPQEYLKRL